MKILSPPAVGGPQTSPGLDSKDGLKKAPPGSDFASALKKAARRKPEARPGPGNTVSLENQRALHLPSPGDLGQAGQLLNRLGRDIRAASPEALNKLHQLEGLVRIQTRTEA